MDSIKDVYKTKGNGKRSIATVSTEFKNDLVRKKKAYSIRQTITVADGATKDILFDPTLFTNGITFEPFRLSVTIGPIRLYIYPNITNVGVGDAVPLLNRYGLVDDGNSLMAINEDPTGLDLTGSTALEYIIGFKSTNQTSGGGVIAGEDIFIIEPTYKYLFRFDNNEDAGEDSIVSIQIDWFEEEEE